MKTTMEFVGRLFSTNLPLKRLLRFAGCFLLILVIWIALSAAMASFLIVDLPNERADAIVVLSGATTYIERVEEAAALYSAGVASKILLTNDGLQGGWNDYEKRNLYFYERSRRLLIQKGVPEASIEVLLTPVQGTIDEARIVIEGAVEKKISSILIVTSPYHTRRALWTYQRINSGNNEHLTLGIRPVSGGRQSPSWHTWWLTRAGWQMVPSEYIKLAYYKLRY